jgi:hypothetical protein
LDGNVKGDIAGESDLGAVAVSGIGSTVLPFVGTTIVVVWVSLFILDELGVDSGGVTPSFSSSGMGGQYVFRTCFSCGLRIGFARKKFIPESRHS